MAAFQNFRGAINGFNREDVVNYIARLNHDFETQMNRLNNELNILRQDLEQAQGGDGEVIELKAQLEEALEKNAQLEQELEALRQKAGPVSTSDELETYRRAERAERLAKNRVSQMYNQAHAAIADTAANLDAAAENLGFVAQEAMEKIQALQFAVSGSKQVITDAAQALGSIRPGEEEE